MTLVWSAAGDIHSYRAHTFRSGNFATNVQLLHFKLDTIVKRKVSSFIADVIVSKIVPPVGQNLPTSTPT